MTGIQAPGDRFEQSSECPAVDVCAAWAGGRAAQLVRTGSHNKKEAPDGHSGTGRLLWTISRWDAELGLRAARAAWADWPHGWRRRVKIGHWKHESGTQGPHCRFGRTFVGMPSESLGPRTVCVA